MGAGFPTHPSIADVSLDSSTGSMDAFVARFLLRFMFGFVSKTHQTTAFLVAPTATGWAAAVKKLRCRGAAVTVSAAAAAPAP